MDDLHAEVIAATEDWLDRAVIGLNLCPFAKSVRMRGQIGIVVSEAATPELLRADLDRELRALAAADPARLETTLLVHPAVLLDFLDFNDFLGVAEELVATLGLEGELQVASFHPEYQFAGTEPDAIENCTNRSPYPTLHLLRESSIEAAVATLPDPAEIYQRNIALLRRLGRDGWDRLWD